ncbi:hypothetical protein C7T94_03720 [Pedobacter yulinensis]|uniref:Uncharacterized protein n=1 Tax=Pedobacter yulinensis TaxID=2126353 RepID=A0A2T3HRY9_9SPHI|nr:DUF6358 family protein [Pedobacter yulinensis]PST85224.1 hypothetical protein C7T94_03720 [Pedobacter yulinensis]
MGKKIALNIFFTIGLILSGFGLVWSFQNEKYLLVTMFVATGAVFFYLKMQLLKEVRKSFKE